VGGGILSFLGLIDEISVLLGCFVASGGWLGTDVSGQQSSLHDQDILRILGHAGLGDVGRYDVPQRR
jgi:hypothetical protein